MLQSCTLVPRLLPILMGNRARFCIPRACFRSNHHHQCTASPPPSHLLPSCLTLQPPSTHTPLPPTDHQPPHALRALPQPYEDMSLPMERIGFVSPSDPEYVLWNNETGLNGT